jgi:hypothetical protein
VKSILSRRPSPALVISCVALFLSLGGVSYGVATGFIDSREIKNNTIRSKDVRNNTLRTFDIRNNEVRGFDIRNSTIQGRDVAFNTLTGDDVSEESFGKVPSAGTADTATAAASVNGVGLSKVVYAAEQGTGPQEILNTRGLRLQASCGVGGSLEVTGSGPAGSEVTSTFPGGASGFGTLAAGDGAGVIAYAAPDDSVVTLQGLAIDELNGVRGTTDDCGFFATAEAG